MAIVLTTMLLVKGLLYCSCCARLATIQLATMNGCMTPDILQSLAQYGGVVLCFKRRLALHYTAR